MTSDLMKAGNDIRHTLFGAFSPAQNVTHKLRTSLVRVRVSIPLLFKCKQLFIYSKYFNKTLQSDPKYSLISGMVLLIIG